MCVFASIGVCGQFVTKVKDNIDSILVVENYEEHSYASIMKLLDEMTNRLIELDRLVNNEPRGHRDSIRNLGLAVSF